MTEIRLAVDLKHPPERVWRALTDSRPLGTWFTPVERDPADRRRYQFRPHRGDGFTGVVTAQIVEVSRGTRLVMRWEGDDLHVRVSLTIEPTAGGSRLTVVQRGFLGRKGTLRRRVLMQAYSRILSHRLPAALDRLLAMESTGSVDSVQVRAALLAALTAPPSIGRARVRTPVRRSPGRGAHRPDLARVAPVPVPRPRTAAGADPAPTVEQPVPRTRLATAGLVAALAVGLSGLVVVALTTGDSRVDRPGGNDGARATPGAPGSGVLGPSAPGPPGTRPAGPAWSAGPSPGGVRPPPAGPVLAATYSATSLHRGYRAEVTISNSGQVPVTGWTVVLRMAGDTRVTAVQAATLQQDQDLLTFTPAAGTGTVPAAGAVRFAFTVTTGGPPVSCEINTVPCAGL